MSADPIPSPQDEWEGRFGADGWRRFAAGYRVIRWSTGGLLAFAVVLVVIEIAQDSSPSSTTTLIGLGCYLVLLGVGLREIGRARTEICRHNSIDPRARRQLSRRRLLDPVAFDAWLAAARKSDPLEPQERP